MSKSIMIDPGHGGTDPGANGFGIREKDWTLKISIYQYERLKKLGANVGITRTTDKSLDSVTRTNLFKNKYDLAISNHWNAFNGSARGVETIHSIHSNGRFATNIANALVKVTGLPLRRVFTRKNNSGGDYYFMHRLSGSTATVIIEYGFLDNKTDHDWYKNENNFYKAAEAVIEVVCKEVGIKYVAPDGKTTPAPSKPAPSKPAPSTGSKSIAQMANEVEAGKHGNGHDNRRKSLGVSQSVYNQVRAEVNRRAGATSTPAPAKKSIAQMATEVINGQHGNGHDARRRSLGITQAEYDKVRAEVNKRAGVSSGYSKTVSQMATEVLQGKHGNGHTTRQNSLGVNNATYQKVRVEVNRRS